MKWDQRRPRRAVDALACARAFAQAAALALALPAWVGAQGNQGDGAAPAALRVSAPASAPAAAASAPMAAASAPGPAAAASAPTAAASAPAAVASAPAVAASAPAEAASAATAGEKPQTAPPPAAASAPPAAAAPTPTATAASAPSTTAASSPGAATSAPVPARVLATGPSACPPPLDTSVPARGEDRGLLWRISRAGQVSHLFGTVHVGKPAWQMLGPLTAAALRASDTLALEVDPTDPAMLAALEDKTPAPPLSEALKKRLIAATENACVPLLALANLHPVLQATTLTVLDARWLGLDPNHSLEMLLVQRAKSLRRRVVSLETAEQQKQALVPADADEALAMIEQTLDQLDSLVSRRVLERLVRAWERSDLDALERYEEWCECAASEEERAYMRRLNDERNGPLADRIAALHGQGRRVFAAIGALHMTGPAALPRLLAERGFKVERLAFAPLSSPLSVPVVAPPSAPQSAPAIAPLTAPVIAPQIAPQIAPRSAPAAPPAPKR